MEYSFNIEHAKKYGVDEAIMIKNFQFWIMKNKANNRNFYDNHYWTYNSVESFNILFPFWTKKQIRRILESLIEKGVLIKGNYNKTAYDRTSWYAFKDESIFLFGQMEGPKKGNRSDHIGTPIPDINTDNKPDKKRESFKKPDLEEIREYMIEYCKSRDFDFDDLGFDEHVFYDHYESVNWHVGKKKMSDFKASIRGWISRRINDPARKKKKSFTERLKEKELKGA